jgi:hypothetical protein
VNAGLQAPIPTTDDFATARVVEAHQAYRLVEGSGVVMTDPKGAAGQSPLKRLSLPDWTPETVRGTIREIEQTKLTPELRMTLGRMALDPRMQTVWGELLKRDRPSGQFKYPALLPESPYLTSIDAVQFAALGETFRFVFSAARKKVPVSKPNEVEQSKESLIQHAQSLRRVANDLRLALSKGQLGIASREMKEQAEKTFRYFCV